MTQWQQPDLFDDLYGGLPPHQKHSDTSKAAAIGLSESRRATLRGAVLRFLQARETGATDEEMQRALGMEGNTQRPRRCELEQAGLVIDSGYRRPTSKGKLATVWMVAG